MTKYLYHYEPGVKPYHYFYAVTPRTWRGLWEECEPKKGAIRTAEKRFFEEKCDRISRLYAYLRTGRQ